jgi:Ca2+-binding RTX toxin-like protein
MAPGMAGAGRACAALMVATLSLSACSSGERSASSPSAGRTSSSSGARSSSPSPPVSGAASASTAPSGAPSTQRSVGRCFDRPPTLIGTNGNDRLKGRPKKLDVIVALGGDDRISGLSGVDAVCAGPGDDLVIGSHNAQLDLGDGNDRVVDLDFSRVDFPELYAGAGDDDISVKRGSDGRFSLGPGDDRIVVRHPRMRAFFDSIPCVLFRSATAPVHVNLNTGRATGQGHDRLVNIRCAILSRYGDVVAGTAFGDNIEAGAGPDIVHTGRGNDDVSGGAGWDRLYGGAGADYLSGGSGGDYLDGGKGNDQLHAVEHCGISPLSDEPGNELFGGPGDDYLIGDKGNDRLDGGPGIDYGQGGYHDHRIDWITSLEHPINKCLSWYLAPPGEPFFPPR